MRRIFLTIALCLSFFLWATPSSVSAQTVASSSAESAFISEKSVVLSEEYPRSVFVTGGQVLVTGHVHGDLVVLGGSVRVRGQVDQDVYAAGGTVFIDGEVKGNVVAAGSELRFSQNSQVGGDILSSSLRLTTEGQVKGSVRSYARHAHVGGVIAGNLHLVTTKLGGTERATVGGTQEVQELQQKQSTPLTWQERLNLFVHRFLLEVLWRGVLLLFVWKFALSGLKKGSSLVQKRPVFTFFEGMTVLVFAALAALLFMITLFGFPLTVIILLSLFVTGLTGWLFVIPWVGEKLLPAQALWLQYALALGALSFVVALPVIGWIVQMLFVAWGVGVWWSLLRTTKQ